MYSYESGKYLSHLMGCALNDRTPSELPKGARWNEILMLARKNCVENMAFHSVEKLQNKPEISLYYPWREMSQKSLVKEVSFNAERGKIQSQFEKQGIRYLPLKGIVIKDYYPVSGMRVMADNDLLYDEKRQKDVLKIMSSLGYSCENLQGNHDVYYKQPIYNFELHKSLMASTSPYYSYFKKFWDRAIKDEGNNYGYHMRHEDFYIYTLVHFFKHYDGAGSGIRSLSDLYVFRRRFGAEIDFCYIHAELDNLKLKDFERKMSSMAIDIFEDKELTAEQKNEFSYILNSGFAGNYRNLFQKNVKKERRLGESLKSAKIRYFWKRLFPRIDSMKKRNPILLKYPVLYPFLVISRLFRIFELASLIKHEVVVVKELKE